MGNWYSYGHTKDPFEVSRKKSKTVYSQILHIGDSLLDSGKVIIESVSECNYGYRIVVKCAKITTNRLNDRANRVEIFVKRIFILQPDDKIRVYGKSTKSKSGNPIKSNSKPGLNEWKRNDRIFQSNRRQKVHESKARKSDQR